MGKPSIETAVEFFERVWENEEKDLIFTMFDGQAEGLLTEAIDPQGYLSFYESINAFLKDFDVEITDWMAQGEQLSIRWLARARHRTKDKAIFWPGSSWGTYRDGKILESQNYFDFMNLFEQLEIVPEEAVARGLAGEEFLVRPRAAVPILSESPSQAELAAAFEGSFDPTASPREQLEQLRATERRLLCSELHDGLAQDLATLWVHLQAGEHQARPSPELLKRCMRLVQAMSRELNSTMARLRAGLLAGSQNLALRLVELRERPSLEGLQVEWSIRGELDRVQGVAAHFACRIIQEALSNVVKHACAQSVRVELCLEHASLYLAVEDDGVGFEPGLTAGGLGLVGMRERCQACGGTFQLRSGLGDGTRIECHLPLNPSRTAL
ncbi:MAG: ATP-binding protein [Vulcanimicrobiota bacterium]